MKNALEVRGLCKDYDKFSLQNVSFTLPSGCIMGFIGENGAGKSTTIKAILGLVHRDAGEISVFGRDNLAEERAVKSEIGFVLEDAAFPPFYRAADVSAVMRRAYPGWDEAQFYGLLERLRVPRDKKVSDYSKGMRMKLSIAAALSHGARLLLLDEPTSGLDPIVRDEVLDLFWEFLQDETHSVLLSSHITSDLDKIADYITLIHEGCILLSAPRDELTDSLRILKCPAARLSELDPQAVLGTRTGTYGAEALVRRDLVPQGWALEAANIEQIMLMMTRGDQI